MPQPEPKGGWLSTVAKVLLWFIAIAIGLSVLAFGTCLLIFANR